ncbi:hypothetical protein BGW41_002264 [Actinomortierella wolfii]|nr:hypothetical protein BGW41_002264 [Actinomortierella wolfii]
MSLIGDILDPLLPGPNSPSPTAAPTSDPPVVTTPPKPTTEPPVVEPTTTSILTTIPTPDPPAPSPTTQPPPNPNPNPNPTKNPRPQPTTSRGSSGGGSGGGAGGGSGGGNIHPIGPTPSLPPGNLPNGTTADAQKDSNPTGSGSTATIVGTVVGVAAAVVLILAGLLIWRKRQQRKQSFEALFGPSSLAAASGLNKDGSNGDESTQPIYARDVEEGIRENKTIPSPPPLAALEPAYGGGEQTYYQHQSPMSPGSAPHAGYDNYDPYYQQGGEAYNMQDYNTYHQGGGGEGYDRYDYGHYSNYPATSTAGAAAATGAHQDDLDSMAYYPYDQSGGAQDYNQGQQPSYGNSVRRRP